VLITRPEPGASATALRVKTLGYTPVLAPMLRIVPRMLGAAAGIQAIVITSANAVSALTTQHRATPIYAVGDATASAARDAGFAAVHSAGRDADALARLIRDRMAPKDGPVLLASGARQGHDLAQSLRHGGFRVRRRVAYEAVPLTRLPAAATQALARGHVCAVLVFSAETAQAFCAAFANCQELSAAMIKTVDALVISNAVEHALFHLPWRRIRVASHPNQDELVALLP
jgi:uroporphyrinogen-III synthase